MAYALPEEGAGGRLQGGDGRKQNHPRREGRVTPTKDYPRQAGAGDFECTSTQAEGQGAAGFMKAQGKTFVSLVSKAARHPLFAAGAFRGDSYKSYHTGGRQRLPKVAARRNKLTEDLGVGLVRVVST